MERAWKSLQNSEFTARYYIAPWQDQRGGIRRRLNDEEVVRGGKLVNLNIARADGGGDRQADKQRQQQEWQNTATSTGQ